MTDENTIREALAIGRARAETFEWDEEATFDAALAALDRLTATLNEPGGVGTSAKSSPSVPGSLSAGSGSDKEPTADSQEWWVVCSESHLEPDALAYWGFFDSLDEAQRMFPEAVTDPRCAFVPLALAGGVLVAGSDPPQTEAGDGTAVQVEEGRDV